MREQSEATVSRFFGLVFAGSSNFGNILSITRLKSARRLHWAGKQQCEGQNRDWETKKCIVCNRISVNRRTAITGLNKLLLECFNTQLRESLKARPMRKEWMNASELWKRPAHTKMPTNNAYKSSTQQGRPRLCSFQELGQGSPLRIARPTRVSTQCIALVNSRTP